MTFVESCSRWQLTKLLMEVSTCRVIHGKRWNRLHNHLCCLCAFSNWYRNDTLLVSITCVAEPEQQTTCLGPGKVKTCRVWNSLFCSSLACVRFVVSNLLRGFTERGWTCIRLFVLQMFVHLCSRWTFQIATWLFRSQWLCDTRSCDKSAESLWQCILCCVRLPMVLWHTLVLQY